MSIIAISRPKAMQRWYLGRLVVTDDVQLLLSALGTELPGDWQAWPGGWPDQIEAALMDAVLSIRARYGRSDNGVRGAIARWSDARAPHRLDDLHVLATINPAQLAVIVGQQKLPGGAPKALGRVS